MTNLAQKRAQRGGLGYSFRSESSSPLALLADELVDRVAPVSPTLLVLSSRGHDPARPGVAACAESNSPVTTASSVAEVAVAAIGR